MVRVSYLLCYCLVLLLSSCIEPFDITSSDKSINYLVVDGFINTDGYTTIRLTRTLPLTGSSQAVAETRAVMNVEGEDGSRVRLADSGGGYYGGYLQVNTAIKYRLHFITSGGKEYASEYVTVKRTPPIDDVTWKADNNGLQVEVSAHDATNQTQYYRWDYEETWQFTSAFASELEYVNGTVRPRTNNIYNCWATENSTAINVSNTTRLSTDVVYRFPFRQLPTTSTRLRYKYSILVKQYAQTPQEYAYWQELKKNTENIGTLFDPLPSQLTGNVRCISNPSEPVLGYVGGYSVTEKRIFIARNQLPLNWIFSTGYESCRLDTVPRNLAFVFGYNQSIPIREEFYPSGPAYYLASSVECVDCRKHGTNVKPSFWQ